LSSDQVGADVLAARHRLGEQVDLGAEQLARGSLEFARRERITVRRYPTTRPLGSRERSFGDAMLGGEPPPPAADAAVGQRVAHVASVSARAVDDQRSAPSSAEKTSG
jgi:hypothetical protein